MSREAMKLALEALEVNNQAWKSLADSGDAGFWEAEEQPFYELSVKAITAIKQARALDKKAENARELGLDYEPVLKDNSNYRYDPPVAEPVAWAWAWLDDDEWQFATSWSDEPPTYAKPLYTTPPAAQRQWVGLTDEEINSVRYKRDWTAPWTDTTFARAIEAKLKEQNT